MVNAKSRWAGFLVAALALNGVAFADDIRPNSDARPHADEKCIERCDVDSDKCMADSQGDPDKLQSCDENYSTCLQACEAN